MSEELLSHEEYELLSGLQRDLDVAQSDAAVRAENKADGECLRRGIRDRLKKYVQRKNFLDKGLIFRVRNTLAVQDKLIMEKTAALRSLEADNKRLREAFGRVNDWLKPKLSVGYPSDEMMGLHYIVRDALFPEGAREGKRIDLLEESGLDDFLVQDGPLKCPETSVQQASINRHPAGRCKTPESHSEQEECV